MTSFNGNKKIKIEIHSNDNSGANGYTVWRIINGQRKDAISRRADGKDFDWMTDRQTADFEKGKFQFTLSAADASQYFNYLY